MDEINHWQMKVGICADEHIHALDAESLRPGRAAHLVELLIIDEAERLTPTALGLLRDRHDRTLDDVIEAAASSAASDTKRSQNTAKERRSPQLRPKRAPGPRVETSVVRLLERDRADGLGLVDEAGDTYRQFYYDVKIFTSPAP